MYLIYTVDPSTVCVSIEVNFFENERKITSKIYHISDVKVNGAKKWPTYKSDYGALYIYYFPDAYGWRIGDLLDSNESKEYGFTFASNASIS